MAKHEIIKTIVDQHGDNERVLNSLFGHVIIEACKKELNRPVEEYFTLIKASARLLVRLDQVKTNTQFLKDDLRFRKGMNEDGFPFPYEIEEIEKKIKSNEWRIKALELALLKIVEQF